MVSECATFSRLAASALDQRANWRREKPAYFRETRSGICKICDLKRVSLLIHPLLFRSPSGGRCSERCGEHYPLNGFWTVSSQWYPWTLSLEWYLNGIWTVSSECYPLSGIPWKVSSEPFRYNQTEWFLNGICWALSASSGCLSRWSTGHPTYYPTYYPTDHPTYHPTYHPAVTTESAANWIVKQI